MKQAIAHHNVALRPGSRGTAVHCLVTFQATNDLRPQTA
jgi:hypothetical protein